MVVLADRFGRWLNQSAVPKRPVDGRSDEPAAGGGEGEGEGGDAGRAHGFPKLHCGSVEVTVRTFCKRYCVAVPPAS